MLWLCSGAGRSTKHATFPLPFTQPPKYSGVDVQRPRASSSPLFSPSLLLSLLPLAQRYRDRTSVPKSRHPLFFARLTPPGCHLAASRLHLSTFPDTSTKHAKQASTHSHLLCAVCMGILPVRVPCLVFVFVSTSTSIYASSASPLRIYQPRRPARLVFVAIVSRLRLRPRPRFLYPAFETRGPSTNMYLPRPSTVADSTGVDSRPPSVVLPCVLYYSLASATPGPSAVFSPHCLRRLVLIRFFPRIPPTSYPLRRLYWLFP
ncbi:hypothetical protein FA13DRAFT_1744078 [Coprinellus micaceus]|uniref:Uncharacterized protein n=1 Tax=Coprinellus micaceus TaxID=71717 RepID=A0A4Y7SDK1_COPMI|nr:hypothetical protein FA13DRAFT_1744078 [Coprinellus micaceus]